MKKTILGGLFLAIQLASCSPSDPSSTAGINPVGSTPANAATDTQWLALQQQFQGKYKVISSVSSKPVDVNLDGEASTNLLREIDELMLTNGEQYNFELKIYTPTQQRPEPSYLCVQWWPEQFIRTGAGKVWDGGELISYNPAYSIGYDFQGTWRSFSLSSDRKQLTVNPNASDNPYRWVRPSPVTVEQGNRLRVVNTRRLYTRSGVEEVTITSVYERFTM